MSTVDNLIKSVTDTLSSHFPNALVRASGVEPTLSGKGGLFTVTFGLVGDADDIRNSLGNILENDPVSHKWIFWVTSEDDITVEVLRSGICINPTNPFYAMSTVKTKWRKTTGNPKKIVKAFERFSLRLADLVTENESNIYQRKRISDKYFNVN